MASRANIDAGGAGFELSLEDSLTRDLNSALSEASKAVRSIAGVIDRDVKAIGQSIQGLGRKIAAIGVGATAAGVGSSLGFAKATIAAGNFAETVNMFDQVFKDQSKSVRAWSQDYGKAVGRSREQLMRFLAESQDTFVPLGFDRAEAAELSKTVTKLAVDLGSFKNIDDGEALRRLLGGIIGNTENLRAFGVVAQEAQIKAKAFDLGFDPDNLTAYQKALTILELTIAGTADAQGDALRTADSFNNSIKALRSAFADLVIEVGEPLREIASKFIQSAAFIVQGLAGLLREFPIVSKLAAGVSLAMSTLGAVAVGIGGAFIALGSVVAKTGIAIYGLDKIGIRIGGVIGALINQVVRLRAAFAGMIARSAISVAFKAIVASVVAGIGLIAKAAVAAGATIAKALVNPWTLLIAAIVLATEAAKNYYVRQEEFEKRKGEGLERERQRIVAQSFIDAGQAVPSDLSKTFNPNSFVVNNDPATGGALSNANRDLADEILGLRSPVELFKERMQGAADLLKRGTISREQFDKFAKIETQSFRGADPATQERDSLIDQLKSPFQKFRESVMQAKKFFADQPELLKKAIDAARASFEASDPGEQLKAQLMTPAERFRVAIENARKLFADQPEIMRRAFAAASDEFKASQPKPQDDPAVQAADRIKEAIKTDAQKVAEQIAEATSLVGAGKLDRQDGETFVNQLRKDFLGDNPGKPSYKQLATQSAAVAGNIGKFGPSFSNTASEERTYRRKAIELQQAANAELKKIRNRQPVFI